MIGVFKWLFDTLFSDVIYVFKKVFKVFKSMFKKETYTTLSKTGKFVIILWWIFIVIFGYYYIRS